MMSTTTTKNWKEAATRAAQQANGTRRVRILDDYDIEIFIEMLGRHADNEGVRSITVYSRDGFVTHVHPGHPVISRLVAVRDEHGEWTINGETASATRSYGRGPTRLVNDIGV